MGSIFEMVSKLPIPQIPLIPSCVSLGCLALLKNRLTLVLVFRLGQVLECIKESIQLGPLYSLTQPLSVIKTRILYRTIQTLPAPRFQEIDDDGNAIETAKLELQPVSWRRIR